RKACVPLGEYLAESEQVAERESRTFFQELPGIFKYPFGKGGVLLLTFGTIVFSVVDALAQLRTFHTLFLSLAASGYFLAYMQSIIMSSAKGEDDLPEWPEFGDWWSDIIRPFFMVVFTAGICFAPAIGYMIMTAAAEDAEMNTLVLFPLIGLGFLYFPMALLVVAMADSFFGVNPLIVIPAIIKVPLEYLVACVAFFVILGARMLLIGLLKEVIPIPYLYLIPGSFVALYLLTVEMRLLGLLYYTNRDRFGWT
ncbi:MAG: DUF4013 domain-containing protein, partial [Candidatus Zixiibacteriota bacterium]